MSCSSLCGKFTLIIQINKSLDKESGVAGESYLPADKFSNFALHLATMYKGENQSVIQGTFNKMFDLIQGIQEADLFNENPDTTPRTLVEAIKEVLNIDYNGQLRSNVLGDNHPASQRWQQGSTGNVASGEQNQSREESTERGRGVEGDGGRSRSDEEREDDLQEVEEVAQEEVVDAIGESQSLENEQQPIEAEDVNNGRQETVGTPVALSYLLEGGRGSIENAGYFLYGVQAAFPHISAQIQRVRDRIESAVLGMTPDAYVSSNHNSLSEIRDLVSNAYGEAGLEIYDKLLANSTGFYPREGVEVGRQIENLQPQEKYTEQRGAFGNIYTQFKGKAKEAIQFLLEKKEGEAVAALHHPEIGDIDLVWGKEGTGKSDGFGLAKLAKYHPEVLDNLQEILDEMKVTQRSENRVQLESDTHQAAVRLTWDNVNKNWLLTAFEKKNSVFDNTTDTGETSNGGKRNDTATPQNTVSNSKVTDISTEEQKNEVENVGGAQKQGGTSLNKQVQEAEAEVNVNPTEKQKEAGNYKKGHVQIGTFDITIEQPKGSVRSGVDANGKKWETEMKNTYGYIRGTEGVDGDHIDVFLSDDIDGWNGRQVYVVDQYNEDGSFDEHKVMLGFNDIDEAQSAYLSNYEKDWANKHKIVVSSTNIEDFEKWIASSHRKTKAFAEYKSVKKTEGLATGESVQEQAGAGRNKPQQAVAGKDGKEQGAIKGNSLAKGDKWEKTGEPDKFKTRTKKHADSHDVLWRIGKKQYGSTTAERDLLRILADEFDSLEAIWNAYENGELLLSQNEAAILKKLIETGTKKAELQQGELDLDVNNPAFERATTHTIDALKAAGVEVVEATQEMVDAVMGLAEMHKQKKAPETVSVQDEHLQTVVSSADGAKVLKDLDSAITEYENDVHTKEKTFLGRLAEILGATKHGSNSQYATFEAVNGKVFTIRLANHNAKVSNFDNHGENEGISIVVTSQDNNGINNDGNAHVVEFFYDAIKLRKADGKPLVEILKSIKQALYSGEYKDTTGLAQAEEVNIPEFMQVYHGSGATFDKFDHSFMGTGEGAQAFGWGTYVTEVEGIGRSYAKNTSDNIFKTGFGDFYLKKIREGMADGKSFEDIKQNLLDYHAHVYEQAGGNKDMFGGFISDYETLRSLKEEDLPKRNLYTVEIPDDTGKNYLDWYNGITDEQKKMIADAAQKEGIEFDFYGDKMNANEYFAEMGKGIEGHQLYGMLKRVLGSDKAASEFLNRIGYVGIKYPTESLSGGNKDGKSNYVIFNEADAKITDRVEFLRTADGVVYGWAVDGKIYLTKEGMNPNTPAHEYTHLWAHMIEKTDSTLWSRIVDGLRGCATWNEVLNDKAYESIWNDDSRMASEVLSRLTGSENYRREMARAQQEIADAKGALEKAEKISAWEKVKMALRDFLGKVRKLLNINGKTAKVETHATEVGTTDIPSWMEFVDWALGDLYGGVNPVEVVNRRGRDAMSVETIIDEFGLNPTSFAEIISSREGLDIYKGFLDNEIYDSVIEAYNRKLGGVAFPNIDLAFVFKEHCYDELGEQLIWWHEQTHIASMRITIPDKANLANQVLEWLNDNASEKHEHILSFYEPSEWGEEGIAAFIEELIERLGTSKFLKSDFAELGELAKLADIIRNTIKYGTKDTKEKLAQGHKFGIPNTKPIPEFNSNRESGVSLHQGRRPDRRRKEEIGGIQRDATQGASRTDEEIDSLSRSGSESYTDDELSALSDPNDGDTLFSYKPFGGNSGYVGYSMSKRAKQAKEEGRFPKTDFKKEYGVTDKTLDFLVQADIVSNSEWHHTSSYGNKTFFYKWEGDSYADFYTEHKAEIDKIARDLAKTAPKLENFEMSQEGADVFTEQHRLWLKRKEEVIQDLQERFEKAEEAWQEAEQARREAEQARREAVLKETRLRTEYNTYIRNLNVPEEYKASNGVRVVTHGDGNPYRWDYYWGENKAFKKYSDVAREELKQFIESNRGDVPNFEEWKEGVATASQLTGTDGATTMSQRSGQADVVTREGEGSFSDDALSGMSDPMAKMLGASTYSARQRREFAERARKRMVRRAESIAKELHLDNVEVVTDVSVLPEGKKRGAKGFYSKSTGKITIVVPNHAGTYDIQQTVLHEAVAHYGLRQLFGTHFDTFLDNVFENVSSEIRNRIIGLARQNGWDFRTATEEYLAMLAEDVEFSTAQKSSWWSKIKGFFLKMLADAGVKLDFTLSDNELRYILWRSYQNLANPGKYASVVEQAADIAKQYDLKVGNYRDSATDLYAVAEQVREREDVLFREDTPRERAIIRDRYERRVKTGWGCCVQSLNNSF